jgi:DNA polymerase I-like protein with 3'-5' exonuclease and polymerase domains
VSLRLLVHDELVVSVKEEDALSADKIFEKELSGWNLKTKWGSIPVKSEGGVFNAWTK